MSYEELAEESKKYLMNTYARQPVVFRKGRGNRLYDVEGKEYIDFVSGVAVNNLGHCSPKVTVAIQKQAQKLVHVSNLYQNEPQIKLAKLLVKHSFADKVFFGNSGAEANEAAIKLARKYARTQRGEDRFELITMDYSFHGRTLGTLSATAQTKYQKDFEPMLPGFRYVPFNDVGAVAKAITAKTIGVLVEPIQAEGGVRVPSDDFFSKLRKLCDEQGLLLILDEVQTGMGRTGRLFAYEHYGIEPDIMTLAKGLGGGVPIGAMLAKDSVADAFSPGSHASTLGGNPLACAAAIAAVESVLEDDGALLDHCQLMSDYFMKGLWSLSKRYPVIKEVRGKGLLVGMELSIEGKPIVQACLEEGFLINCTVDRVLRFIPPLTITQKEIDLLLKTLDRVFKRGGG
jgi:predicted acetylornithine/succinylornithine family transaminase